MELDHIIPDHLGNDPDTGGNWQLLCKPCNRGKNEWIHYTSKFGKVATLHSEINDYLLEPVRYAALERDEGCSFCSATPKSHSLYVKKKHPSGCWVLDNSQTVCSEHLS